MADTLESGARTSVPREPLAGRTATRTLILGIGNVLMGDEGIGVHVARRLYHSWLPPDVDILDGGTGGFHLLGELASHDPVILIDATMDGLPPGTVSVRKPRYAADFPPTLTAHDIGLRDLIVTAALLETLPTVHLVTVSIDRIQSMDLALSAPVDGAIPRVLEQVWRLIA